MERLSEWITGFITEVPAVESSLLLLNLPKSFPAKPDGS